MHRRTSTSGKLMLAIASRLAKAADRDYQPRSIFRRTVGALLELSAFVLLTLGAFELNSVAGKVVAALSCFVLAWHINSGDAPSPDPSVR